ncbi:MAG: sigma 54-interacting transcriptional regulator [Deltaproteobacteria bacterium]|nr:sigma 54-interacting transcriptional regulator [Deltaproteobacteria bacterium]
MADNPKFPDFAAPTKLAYVKGRPTEIHLRRCKFILTRGATARERIFDQSVIRVGAMEDNDLVINHETVSRYHCKVIQDPDGYVLVDEGSTNGTFINKVRIREGFLSPGCSIQVGQVDISFDFADEKVPIVPSNRDRMGPMVGQSVPMREIYGIIEKIATTGTTVVIEGETGTGKELVAQTIHNESHRKSKPMMVFDCGAVPENLIESELFGHEKGSFTGAVMSRRGLFEAADGGTIFLDEIGELSLELQPKLLRALEQRTIRRVGSNRSIKIDVRVIAATHRTLAAEVRAERFRQDLFYRLSVVRIALPPLRDRHGDIPLLVHHLLKHGSFNHSTKGAQRVDDIDNEALERLIAHPWPGNVRELVNVIEYAVSFSHERVIRVTDLPETLRPAKNSPNVSTASDEATFKDAKERWVSSFERDYLIACLKKNNGNISHAARDADIDRKYFRKLMRKYGIAAAAFGKPTPHDE